MGLEIADDDLPYQAETRSIRVAVRPSYRPDQSAPDEDHFVWAYRIRIENRGPETVQLRTRHWVITDGNGRVQEVRGPGVVGEEPVLRPGQSFEYVSGVPLSTPTGLMQGSYGMHTDEGEHFEVEVPPFSLDSPQQVARPN